MFAVFSTPKKINIVKKLLKENGLKIRETKLPEYILIRDDPSPFIPNNLKETVKVLRFEDGYFSFLKEANTLKEILESDNLKKGDPVKITDGAYKDFAGIITEANDNGTYNVEISIWGKIVKEILGAEQMERQRVLI